MADAVREAVRLNATREDGSTLREHLENVERVTGKQQFDEPALPDGAEYLWGWFWDLDAGRGSNGFGLNPLSYSEMKAWAELTQQMLDPWEVSALRKMDMARLEAVSALQRKTQGRQ